MKKLIALALLLVIQGGASPQPQNLGTVRPVTSFPTITPVDADYFIFSDVSNSSLFSRATLTSTKAALGVALTATGFNGNLATTDDTLQEVAQKLDDLVFGDPANDTAYDATTWDANADAPTKNAIRDEIETFPTLTFSTGLTETDGTVTVTPNTYQPLLVSTVNIKSINGSSLVGSGDISLSSGGSAPTVQSADPTSASATGWYVATGTGDLFYKSDDGLFTIAGSYAADPPPSGGIADDFSSDTSANYTRAYGAGTLAITGGYAHVSNTFSGRSVFYHETTVASADQHVYGNIDNEAEPSGFAVRVDLTGQTCYLVNFNSSGYLQVRGFNLATGAWGSTEVYSSGTYAAGSRLVDITINGSSFVATVDGVPAISTTVTEFSSGDYAGFSVYRDAADPKVYDFNAEAN